MPVLGNKIDLLSANFSHVVVGLEPASTLF